MFMIFDVFDVMMGASCFMLALEFLIVLIIFFHVFDAKNVIQAPNAS